MRIPKKRRALLITLSPLLLLLPLLWVFGPHWAWKLQGHDLGDIMMKDINWEDIPIEDAVAELNAKLHDSGSKIRLRFRPSHLANLKDFRERFPGAIYSTASISTELQDVRLVDVLFFFSEFTGSSYYPSGHNTLLIDSFDSREWPVQARLWGRGISNLGRLASLDFDSPGLDPSYQWISLVDP